MKKLINIKKQKSHKNQLRYIFGFEWTTLWCWSKIWIPGMTLTSRWVTTAKWVTSLEWIELLWGAITWLCRSVSNEINSLTCQKEKKRKGVGGGGVKCWKWQRRYFPLVNQRSRPRNGRLASLSEHLTLRWADSAAAYQRNIEPAAAARPSRKFKSDQFNHFFFSKFMKLIDSSYAATSENFYLKVRYLDFT